MKTNLSTLVIGSEFIALPQREFSVATPMTRLKGFNLRGVGEGGECLALQGELHGLGSSDSISPNRNSGVSNFMRGLVKTEEALVAKLSRQASRDRLIPAADSTSALAPISYAFGVMILDWYENRKPK